MRLDVLVLFHFDLRIRSGFTVLKNADLIPGCSKKFSCERGRSMSGGVLL